MEAARESTLYDYYTSAATSTSDLRPIMTSLNGDNSWLLSFPRLAAERSQTGKVYYHIVFEPWLDGPTGYFSSWFIHIQQLTTSAVPDAQGVYAVAQQIEKLAKAALGMPSSAEDKALEDEEAHRFVDAILLGFHYSDHVHETTLRLFDPSIPVFATPEAISIIKPWNHFTTVNSIASMSAPAKSWRAPELHPGGTFPSWLSPVRLLGHHELNYVLALVWTHAGPDGGQIHEAILQTPHGTKLDEGPLQNFLDSEPEVTKLAMLHGLKESHAMGSMNTLGAEGGVKLWRRIGGARYWVLSHHSSLSYSGIVMRLLRVTDTPRTIEWALQREEEQGVVKEREKPNVIEVENGGSFVLV